jgi:penicillin amidase
VNKLANAFVVLCAVGAWTSCKSGQPPTVLPASPDLVTNLTYPVQVYRDERGIAHIYAQGQGDLLFAQGYEMARDRLFHMDWMRRFTYGTRAQAFGAGPLNKYRDDDVVKRAIGFQRLGIAQRDWFAEHEPATLQRINSFCNGVNAFIRDAQSGHNGAARPADLDRVEAGYWPAPWQPEDVFAIAKALVFSQNFQGDVELILFGSHLLLGPDKFADLFRFQPFAATWILEDTPTAPQWGVQSQPLTAGTVRPPDLRMPQMAPEQKRAVVQALLLAGERLSAAKGLDAPGDSGGSNSWVIAGPKTGGKGAILCNDPHMALEQPSRLLAMHLVDTTVDATGTFGHQAPGMPWLTFGATARVGWAITNSFTDTTDLYDEVLCPDGKSVQFKQQCVPITYHNEVILVRPEGGKIADAVPETHTLREVPHHGPVINDILPPQVATVLDGIGKVFSARWPGFSPETGEAVALAGLMTAQDVDEALHLLERFDGGVLNWSLADHTGRIAYVAAGRFPQRARSIADAPPWLPLDGTGKDEWQGWLSQADMPHVADPAKGYIVTANNQQGPQNNDNDPRNDPLYWAAFTDLGTRAWEISKQLAALPTPIALPTAAQLHNDQHSVLADGLLPALLAAEATVCSDAQSQDCQALQLLKTWDREQTVDSAAGAIWSVWLTHFMVLAYGDDLPDLLRPLLNGFVMNLGARATVRWIDPQFVGKTWFDDPKTPAVETAQDIAALALHKAVAQLASFSQKPMAAWRLGDVHQTKLQHLVWDEWSIGPVAHAGGCRTVNAGDYKPYDSKGQIAPLPYLQSEGAVFRMCVQLSDGDPVGVQSLAGGQSSQHDDPHAADQLPDWLAGKTAAIRWTLADVQKLPQHLELPAGL